MSIELEKENTYRQLKGEEPIVTSRWCNWGFHKWTQWQILPDSGTLEKSKKQIDGFVVYELYRYCIHCKRLELAYTTSKGTIIKSRDK